MHILNGNLFKYCILLLVKARYPIEKILEEILVLFSDEENTRKSARIFKFLEEIRELEN